MASSIYALCDPDTSKIRYIGRTSGHLLPRLAQHVVNAFQNQDSNRPVVQWVLILANEGKMPKIVLIEECDKSEVAARETYHIKQHAQSRDLLNMRSNEDFDWAQRANVTLPSAMVDYIRDVAEHQQMPVYRLVLEAVQAYAIYHGAWPYQDGK